MSVLLSRQTITSMVSSCQMVHLILSQPTHNFDQKENVIIQADDNIYVIIQPVDIIYVIIQQMIALMLSPSKIIPPNIYGNIII
jgi:hypothetical protein